MIANAGLGLASVVLLFATVVSGGTTFVGIKHHDKEELGLVVIFTGATIVFGLLCIASTGALLERVW